jgi:serine/threonine protein kinase
MNMNKEQIENAILAEGYRAWLRNGDGSFDANTDGLEGVDETQLRLVLDDMEEEGLIDENGRGLTAQGITRAETRAAVDKETIDENVVTRSALVQAAFDTRENEGRHSDITLDTVREAFSLNEDSVYRNADLMKELGWIEFRTTRSFRITPFGRDSYRQQREEASGKENNTGSTIFETTTNSYRVLGTLGQGGVGIVYEVTDSEGKSFALKIMRESVLSNEKTKRFRQELEFLKANRHPNLVPVLDDGFVRRGDKKIPFYVMPKYDGTLGDLMKKKLSPQKALKYFADILDGIEALHLKGNFHRDFKPENVLYDQANDVLRIGDLGAAHFAADELFTAIETRNDSRMANFEFAAPEQRERGRGSEVNHLADIYALGLVLNKMITGRTPSGEGYPKIADGFGNFAYLDELVTEMIRHSPTNRFRSIQDIKIRLKALEKDFVSLQKLDRLRNEVVPSGTPIDPLIDTPVQIVGVDFDHEAFRFELDRPVNQEWTEIFSKIDDRNHGLFHAWPQDMEIKDNLISVPCTGEAAVLKQSGALVRDLVTRYVNNTNNGYKTHLAARTRQMEQNQIRAEKHVIDRKNQEIAREEERRSILAELAAPKDN